MISKLKEIFIKYKSFILLFFIFYNVICCVMFIGIYNMIEEKVCYVKDKIEYVCTHEKNIDLGKIFLEVEKNESI